MRPALGSRLPIDLDLFGREFGEVCHPCGLGRERP